MKSPSWMNQYGRGKGSLVVVKVMQDHGDELGNEEWMWEYERRAFFDSDAFLGVWLPVSYRATAEGAGQ